MTDEQDIVKELRDAEQLADSRTEQVNDSIGDSYVEPDDQCKIRNGELGNIEEIYKTVFENSAVAIMVTDKNEQIISWNKYAADLLGMTKDDLYLKPVKSLYPLEEWQKIRSENVRQKGMQHHLETKILRKNDDPLDVDISLSVLRNNNGNIIGSIGIIKDITESKQTERELKEAHELLSVVNRDLEKKVEERTSEVKKLLKQKDEFINQLGHDLKSPLTPILNLLPKVIKRFDDPKTMERLEVINRNADYIRNLVNDTLKLAKLNSQSIELNMCDIKLVDLAGDVIKDSQFLFEENEINVENLIDNNFYVTADVLQLKEVLNNLSSNAVKFMQPGDTLTLDAEMDKDYVTISVTDTGLGLTEEQIAHIFDEFYKADGSRHNIESSGLGLSICKRIVEWHEGHIWVKSLGLGKGSTFYFSIPYRKTV